MRPRSRRILARVAVALGIVVALAIVAILVAEPIVTRLTRQQLASLEDYTGQVDDVDLSWAGPTYTIEGLRLSERRPRSREPLVTAERVTVGVDLSSLWRWEPSLTIHIDGLHVVAVAPPAREKPPTAPVRDLLLEQSPARISRLVVTDGVVIWRDGRRVARIEDLDLEARNFATRPELMAGKPGTVEVRGKVQGSGVLAATLSVDPFAQPLVADVEGGIERLGLAEAMQLAGLRAGRLTPGGNVSVGVDLALAGGRLRGELRPEARDVEATSETKALLGLAGKGLEATGLAGRVGKVVGGVGAFGERAKERVASPERTGELVVRVNAPLSSSARLSDTLTALGREALVAVLREELGGVAPGRDTGPLRGVGDQLRDLVPGARDERESAGAR